MYTKSRNTWLRRKGMLALPAAAALLALAPAAHASTSPDPSPANYPSGYTPTSAPTIETPTNEAQLESDVAGAEQGVLTIIVLEPKVDYIPDEPLDILPGTDVEITGPPTDQANRDQNQPPAINGQTLYSDYLATDVQNPTIYVEPGAYALLKGFNLEGGGTTQGYGGIEVGGTAEIDNLMDIGADGTGLTVDDGGVATMTDSTIADGYEDAIEEQGDDAGGLTLINDTISGNYDGGIIDANEQYINIYNTIDTSNNESGSTIPELELNDPTTYTGAGNYTDDDSFPSGATESSTLTRHLYLPAFNGGPSETVSELAGAPTIGKGVAAYCPTVDQRFFLYTKGAGGTCDVGAFQSNGAAEDTSTTGPSVASISTFESSSATTPSTETVNISEPTGIGIGGDVVNNYEIGSTFATDGTVGFPTWDGSLFNAVNSSISVAPLFATTATYPVTATKSDGDLTANDTKWSFFATDWLGNFQYES